MTCSQEKSSASSAAESVSNLPRTPPKVGSSMGARFFFTGADAGRACCSGAGLGAVDAVCSELEFGAAAGGTSLAAVGAAVGVTFGSGPGFGAAGAGCG